ncbi:MAG: hypothetical protein AXA67_09370 [Methylothermaceae bacteria B42]|nr:MAG: hypothetical protein AXA67_09370 [Methylothermaceae bacteria B42]HHJ39515.1 hypothetical protein [Methylothermaceae bacterium]
MNKILIAFFLLLLATGVHADDGLNQGVDPLANSPDCQNEVSDGFIIDGCNENGTVYDKSKDSWTTPGLEERDAQLCGEVSRYAWLAIVYQDKGWTLEDEIRWALENLEPGEFRNLIILAASEAYILRDGQASLDAVKQIVWPRCMNYVKSAS